MIAACRLHFRSGYSCVPPFVQKTFLGIEWPRLQRIIVIIIVLIVMVACVLVNRPVILSIAIGARRTPILLYT